MRGQRWGLGASAASGVPAGGVELEEAELMSRGFPGLLQDLGATDFRMWWNQCWSVLPGCAGLKKRGKTTQGQQL